jgi:hypothetical protein
MMQGEGLAGALGMSPLMAHCPSLGTLYNKADRWEQAGTEFSAAIELDRAMDMTFWRSRPAAALAQVL